MLRRGGGVEAGLTNLGGKCSETHLCSGNFPAISQDDSFTHSVGREGFKNLRKATSCDGYLPIVFGFSSGI